MIILISMISIDCINFKDSLSSTTNMDSTDDNYDDDTISTIYLKKSSNYTQYDSSNDSAKRVYKYYQLIISPTATMFHYSDSIVKSIIK